ncbi:myo-inositol-1(or 4)-monophosphatase [Mesorhizobium soli]|uniref:inositol monophosphatase family protein n=1 Tax=Pseudaminobacter soli (ex Li et al. 2025) TaxID=1295366 RepID=UPI0024766DBC|nr:inositol monophosphatase family protein [Mesorhizobium soli]MDH6233463.1 myo-inositol-1(or 4)-monophosphatase [Mesorhizobium soli]
MNETTAADRFEIAREATLEAGALALSYFNDLASLDIETKANGQDVVSVADREVETLLRARIAEAFPDDGFLGEEFGLTEGASGYTWVIDPIDGTSPFLHSMASWCVSVALMRGPETLLGLVYAPRVDELFSAQKGEGAFLNGRPIRVEQHRNIQTGLLGVGASLRVPPRVVSGLVHGLLERGGMFIRNGSGALALADVACARLAGYYEPHINAWDCMAGLCLVREAGGWTSEFGADDLISGGPVVACAPQLRADLLDLIDTVASENE